MFLSRPNNRTFLALIPDGKAGVVQTLRLMCQLVGIYKRSMDLRDRAISLTFDLPPKDFRGEVERIFGFVRDRIRYIQDIDDVETIQTPDVTLDKMVGDCDDKSLLLASMLASIGHPVRFKAVGYEPGVLEHVYVLTKIGANWIGLDATEQVPVGWEPPTPVEFMIRNC